MATPEVIAWKPLGELLVERGLLTPDELDDALDEQARTGERLGTILVARKAVAGAVLTTLLAEQVGVELETQGGFGTGLFSKLAARTDPGADKPGNSAAARPSGANGGSGSELAGPEDPAYELSALRVELDLLRARNAQLEHELASLRAKHEQRKPAARRRGASKTP
jgi:hypothetical protein